ncbi:MAG: hypothetical protein ACOYBW_11725, partial [Fluviibacter phosphoraccumulans]
LPQRPRLINCGKLAPSLTRSCAAPTRQEWLVIRGSRLLIVMSQSSAPAEQEPFSSILRQGKPKLTVVHHPPL